jgi:hypothetical protein
VPPDLRQCGKTARSRSSMSGAGTSFALFVDSRTLPVVSQGTCGEAQRCQRAYNQTRPMPKDRSGPCRRPESQGFQSVDWEAVGRVRISQIDSSMRGYRLNMRVSLPLTRFFLRPHHSGARSKAQEAAAERPLVQSRCPITGSRHRRTLYGNY